MRGHRVGVHVEAARRRAHADARDDRQVAVGAEIERAGAASGCPIGPPDEPEIGHRARRRSRAAARASTSGEPGVGAGQADRPPAGRVDRRDEPRVDRAGQHLDDDVERGRVGDAQAVDLPLRDARRASAPRRSPCRRRARRPAARPTRRARSPPPARACRAGSSSSSPPSFSTASRALTRAAPCARRSRTRC